MLTLARWLGPWADSTKAPEISTDEAFVGDIRVRLYHPRKTPRATYLIAPGLHYAGPDDPRMDRFCRILAAGTVDDDEYAPIFVPQLAQQLIESLPITVRKWPPPRAGKD